MSLKPLKPSPSVGTRIPFGKPNPFKPTFRDLLALPFYLLGIFLMLISVHIGGAFHSQEINNIIKEL